MIQNKLTKTLFFLLLILVFFTIILCGRPLLVPLAFGGLLAMLFYPMYIWLKKRKVPKWGAIGIAVLIFLLVSSALVGTITYQARSLVQDWPKIRKELAQKQSQMEEFVIQKMGIASQERIDRIKQQMLGQRKKVSTYIQRFFGSFFSLLSGFFLTIVYMIFLLWEEKRLARFVIKLAPHDKREKARNAIVSSRKVAAHYLIGRLILIGILTVLYSIGFMIFGLNYAIPIAVLVAVLSVIPYLGNLIGAVIVVSMALATGNNMQSLFGLLGTMLVAQILESNILTPMIMGDKVDLNPLTTLVAVIGFSIIWGVSGTILAIPLVGILKKIFDHVEGWEPFGYLLGVEEIEK